MKIAAVIAIAALVAPLSGEAALAHSKKYCKKHAEDFADQNTHGLGTAALGTVIGAVGGAIVGGAIGGNQGAGTGAIIGGSGGAIAGSFRGSKDWQKHYDKSFDKCMKE